MTSRPREIAMNRRLEIKHVIEELGLWNISRQPLANKYGVSRQQIDQDIHNIMKGMPAEDLIEIKFNLKSAYRKAMKEMQKIIATSNNNFEKARAAQVIGNLGKQFTEMLENYGLKERIINKHIITGALAHIEIKDVLRLLEDEEPIMK